MYYQGLTWKFKLLMMLGFFTIGLLVPFSYYKEHGYLPNSVIAGVVVGPIFGCLLMILGDRSWRKNYMCKETTTDKDKAD